MKILKLLLSVIVVFNVFSFVLINAAAWAQDSKNNLVITRLFDNESSNKDLKTGWGFSCLIQGAGKTILFDIGSDDAIVNMNKLKIDPASIDVLMISHDHFDHTNGMQAFLKRNKKVKTFFVPRESIKICDNVFTTGEMGTDIKENALIIRTVKGLVVITGCAHPGIVEIVQKAKQMFPGDDVYLVMGGFHLFMEYREANISKIVSDMKKENIWKISPSHCSGTSAESLFKEAFGNDYIPGDVGKPIVIEGAFKKAR